MGVPMGKTGRSSIILLAALFAASLSMCVSKTPLGDAQKDYAGQWVAVDGTSVTIYLDGGGDFKASNTSITGGKATVADDTLTISMGPLKKEMRITAKPREARGTWTMGLDKVIYIKK